MKKLLLIFLAMFSFNSNYSFSESITNHSGKYECRMSSWSPFKTTVSLENFRSEYIISGDYSVYEIDAYVDGKKLRLNGETNNFLIEKNKTKKSYILADPRRDGVLYIYKEKVFSEEKGTKWVIKRKVYCEKND